MKNRIAIFLFLFVTALIHAQTSKPTVGENMKAAAGSTTERMAQGVFNRIAAWVDSLPEHHRNKLARKRIAEANKNKCYDTLECRLDSIAQILVIDARKHGVKRIAVWYFTDSVTKLGFKMAEKLSIALSNADDSLQIVDRQHIDAVMKEHQLNADGLIDPATAKQIGRFLHADAIITGSIRVWKNIVNVNIKMLDVETDVILSGKKIAIPMKDEYQQPANTAGGKGNQIPLSPGFYYLKGVSSEHCVGGNSGALLVKNVSGRDIRFSLSGTEQHSELIKSGEEVLFQSLFHGLYSYSYSQAGNNVFIKEGEFVIHACDNLGYDIH